MSHANAALTPRARLRLARLIVDGGYPVRVAARLFMVSPPTARKWAARYRAEGSSGSTSRIPLGSAQFTHEHRSIAAVSWYAVWAQP